MLLHYSIAIAIAAFFLIGIAGFRKTKDDEMAEAYLRDANTVPYSDVAAAVIYRYTRDARRHEVSASWWETIGAFSSIVLVTSLIVIVAELVR